MPAAKTQSNPKSAVNKLSGSATSTAPKNTVARTTPNKVQQNAPESAPQKVITESLPDKDGYYDLGMEITAAGYPFAGPQTIEQYVRFGSAQATSNALGDQFSELQAERDAEAARQTIGKKTFILKDRRISIPRRNDFEEKGLFISCDLGLALEGGLGADADPKAYSGKMEHVSINKVDDRVGWFLTKDKQIAPCSNQVEMRAVNTSGGYLYYPFGKWHSLYINLGHDLSFAKDVSQNRSRYSVDVIFRNLQYRRLTEAAYYQRQALLDNDLDCDSVEHLQDSAELAGGQEIPLVFRTDTPIDKLPKMLIADLIGVRVKKDGTVIASYDHP